MLAHHHFRALLGVALLALGAWPASATRVSSRAGAAPGGDVQVLASDSGRLDLLWTPGPGTRTERVVLLPGRGAEVVEVFSLDGSPAPAAAAALSWGEDGWLRRLRFAQLVLEGDRAGALPVRVTIGFPPAGAALEAARPAGLASDAELSEGLRSVVTAPSARSEVRLEESVPRTARARREHELASSIGFLNAERLAEAVDASSDPSAWPPAPASLERGSLRLRTPRTRSFSGGETQLELPAGDPSPAGISGGRVKILVDRDGIYRITHDQLATLGFDLSGTPSGDLRVTNRGAGAALEPVAIRVGDADGTFGPGDWIEFWGAALTDDIRPGLFQSGDYTDVNAYWLDAVPDAESDPLNRMLAVPRPPTLPVAADHLATVHVEENDFFIGNHRTGEYNVDHFYWCPSLQKNAAPGLDVHDVTVPLPGLLTGSARPATVRARFLGRSTSAANPDHSTALEVNGTEVGRTTWDGIVVHDEVATPVSPSLFTNPATITASLPGVVATLERVELDWVEVDYPRSFAAPGGRLDFRLDPGSSVVVAGLTSADVTVLDLANPKQPRHVVGTPGAGTVAFDIVGTAPTRHAVASHPVGTPTFVPLAMEWVPDTGLRDPSLEADVVVVAPRAFHQDATFAAALASYSAMREAEDLSVLALSTETVIDEFGDGIFSPFALTYLLQHGLAEWAVAPRFVLLIGDANVDYKNVLQGRLIDGSLASCPDTPDPCGFDETGWVQQVPTRILDNVDDQVFFGYYASDMALSMAAGSDYLPDANVGRLPARLPAEAAALLDKIREYESLRQSPPGWASDVIMVGDEVEDLSEQLIEDVQEEARVDFVEPHYDARHYFYQSDYLDRGLAATDLTADLFADWTGNGAAVLSYVGHGSTFRWSDGILLTNLQDLPVCRDDVASRLTGPYPTPVMINANCITGAFMHLRGPSLLEELVRTPEGGAIATFGPTGITDLSLARGIIRTFYGGVHGPKGRGFRLGEVVFKVQEQLLGNGAIEELFNNVLLGDPALNFVVPFGPPSPPLALVATPGDAIVMLEWDAVPGATSYNVYRSLSTSGPWIEVIGGATGTTGSDATVVNGQLYWFALEPMDGAAPGRWSAPVDARPCTLAVPLPPSNLNANDGPCAGQLNVTWTASPTPNLKGYRLRVYAGTSASGVPEQVLEPGGTFSTVRGLVPFRTYTFVVSALTWCGVESTLSNTDTARATCPLTLDPPAMIRDLRARRSASGRDVVLTWSPVTSSIRGNPLATTGHVVHRADHPDFFADGTTEISRPATPTYTDPNAADDGTRVWFYAVAALAGSERGSLGLDFPQPVTGTAKTADGTDWRVSWLPVLYDIHGDESAVARYHVYASTTALDRQRIVTESLVPAAIVDAPATEALVPSAAGSFHFVVAEDVHGNLSP